MVEWEVMKEEKCRVFLVMEKIEIYSEIIGNILINLLEKSIIVLNIIILMKLIIFCEIKVY